MTEDKQVALPEREDMLTRLRSVINEPHTEDGFYPLLLKCAGARRTGLGIAIMLLLAADDYTAGIPPARVVINAALPRFVTVLVDDADVRAEALAALKMS